MGNSNSNGKYIEIFWKRAVVMYIFGGFVRLIRSHKMNQTKNYTNKYTYLADIYCKSRESFFQFWTALNFPSTNYLEVLLQKV